MPDIKWIKIMTDMLQDEKLKLIRKMPEGAAITVAWLQLMCMAGECNDGGEVYLSDGIPYTDEMLTVILELDLPITRLALETLTQLRMINFINGERLFLPNFEKYQNVEGMERVKMLARDRQTKHRLKEKNEQLRLKEGSNATSRDSNAADKIRVDKNREEKIRGEDTTDALLDIFNEITDIDYKITNNKINKVNLPAWQQKLDDLHFQAENL